MRNETRQKFDQFTQQVAALNGVAVIDKSFTVEPSVQQTLEDHIQLSSAFLQSINMVPVRDMEGEKVGLGTMSTIAGRTKTSDNTPRRPRSVAGLSSDKYRLVQTDFDICIPYALLDAWAKHPDFQVKLRNHILIQQALDRIMIGFNGRQAAEQTNRDINPLLQDVNIGWLEQYRCNAAKRVMTEVGKNSKKILVGAQVPPEKGFRNLDALVFDCTNNLIHETFSEHPDLVVIVGRDLLSDKYFPILNKDNAPSEQIAADMVISQKRIGNLPAVRAPFVPAGTMMITPLSNLSLYYQEGGRRRYLREEPDYNRIANYESSNEGYVVENYEAGCVIENIQIENGGLSR